MPDKAPPEEALTFNYWALILTLLDLGFPWYLIQKLETQEIALILGVHAAMEQRKAEQEAAQHRQQMAAGGGATHFSHVRGR